ncbi:ectoine/hydroxyectoine ABC transporter substrate-binding protein EhuB [Bordetella genomosp. 10]|nr:ectoine/hydroxyectoine ABC transporter substrate-binding protein EhuB [Bordetella genomosp. 10]
MIKFNPKKFVAISAALAGVVTGAAGYASPTVNVDTLTVGIGNNKPWAYKDTDGEIKGINADIVKAVFQSLGVKKLNFVVSDFGSLIPGLLSKRYDVVDSGIVLTPERCKLVEFGDPELSSLDALLVAKGNPKGIHGFEDVLKNPKITIGGTRGSQQAKNAAAAGVTGDQLQQFQNTESSVAALTSHRVDGLVFTSGTANALLERPNLANEIERAKPFKGPTDPKTGEVLVSYVGAAFSKDNAALRDAFNAKLAELKADGTVQKIAAKYGFTPEEKAPDGLVSAKICAG